MDEAILRLMKKAEDILTDNNAKAIEMLLIEAYIMGAIDVFMHGYETDYMSI